MAAKYRKTQPTEHERLLFNALVGRGIDAELGYWDGHKTVDIAILSVQLFIEVDNLRHFTDPDQIMRDLKRSHFSDGDDFNTFYVTNQILDKYLDGVADALVEVVKRRKSEVK
jgi:very-short-patch-repair endonuclease